MSPTYSLRTLLLLIPMCAGVIYLNDRPPQPDIRTPATTSAQAEERAGSVALSARDLSVILNLTLNDVLTGSDSQSTREFYGTVGDEVVLLVNDVDYGVPWPESFQPSVRGFTFQRCRSDERSIQEYAWLAEDWLEQFLGDLTPRVSPYLDSPRRLGIRIDGVGDAPGDESLPSAPNGLCVRLCVSNAGGSSNGAVIGGCLYTFTLKRDGADWKIESALSIDP